jgi:hypothetical protein
MKYGKGTKLVLTKPYLGFEIGHKLIVKQVYPHSSQYFVELEGGYQVYLLEDYVSTKTPDQQRLENVLKHFKKNDKTNYNDFQYYLYLGKTGITIDSSNGKFYLEDNDLHTVQISLDTVESLLKDLGVMK